MKSYNKFTDYLQSNEFVTIDDSTIFIKIQDGPIKEFGHNGEQIDKLLELYLEILQHLNQKFPCRENAITITKVEEALLWQLRRKLDREKRQVEGLNKL
jgi:hypothetical protein